MRRCARRVAEHIAAHQIQRGLRLQRRSIKTDAVLQPCLAMVLSTFNPEPIDVEGLHRTAQMESPNPTKKSSVLGHVVLKLML